MKRTVYTEMLSALMAQELEDTIAALEGEGNGCNTFFAPVSRVLNDDDFKKFIATVRKKAITLRKDANGCPSRIFDWRKHYST